MIRHPIWPPQVIVVSDWLIYEKKIISFETAVMGHLNLYFAVINY
jgi:hypothetical protein